MARQNYPRLRPQPRLVPNVAGIGDPAAQDPSAPGYEDALAQMAALSNVPLTNQYVSQFLRNVSNSTLTASVQTLSNLVGGNL